MRWVSEWLTDLLAEVPAKTKNQLRRTSNQQSRARPSDRQLHRSMECENRASKPGIKQDTLSSARSLRCNSPLTTVPLCRGNQKSNSWPLNNKSMGTFVFPLHADVRLQSNTPWRTWYRLRWMNHDPTLESWAWQVCNQNRYTSVSTINYVQSILTIQRIHSTLAPRFWKCA